MRILLHLCCAPCAVYPLRKLAEKGLETHGFFYNPNIHPYREYARRLEALAKLREATGLPVILRDEYGLQDFLRRVAFRETERCRVCYHLRLRAAARAAKRGKFDAFSSTLLYSRFQRHELIKKTAGSLAREEGIPFYYHDFREGWQEGVRISREMGLYRQPYCGCIYSEGERFAPRTKDRS